MAFPKGAMPHVSFSAIFNSPRLFRLWQQTSFSSPSSLLLVFLRALIENQGKKVPKNSVVHVWLNCGIRTKRDDLVDSNVIATVSIWPGWLLIYLAVVYIFCSSKGPEFSYKHPCQTVHRHQPFQLPMIHHVLFWQP